MKVYFDNAATTPVHPEVVDAMVPVLKDLYGNPSSIHSHGREVRALIEASRKKVANLLKASPAEIFFTSGGTEADNMAIRSSVSDLGVEHIITSPLEHHAILHTVEELAERGKILLSLVKVDTQGHVDLVDLERLLENNRSRKTLVSLMHANNEIGTLISLHDVALLCKKYDALFQSDTVQTMGHLPIDLSVTPVDFITGAAHKFHGPKGVGFIFIRNSVKIHPMITGGAQERNMRGGTENVYGIVGLARALELSCEHLEADRQSVSGLKQYMADSLQSAVPGLLFNGDILPDNGLYTVLNVSFPPSDNGEMLLFNLDIAGIACSAGSACSSGSNVGSHVLQAIQADPNRPAIRFSFSKFNTKDEVDYAVARLKEFCLVSV